MSLKREQVIPVTFHPPPTPKVETRSIHEILSDPESLMSLSDEQLKSLLAPYIPATRKALLPEEKSEKKGLHSNVMKDVIAAFAKDPKMAEQLAALRAAREKK